MQRVLDAYPIGSIESIEPASGGLIHGTWIVDAGAGRFVLQRLHPLLSKPGVLADYRAVTTHLAAHRFPAPVLVATTAGRDVVEYDTAIWRLITWVPGHTRQCVSGPAEAEQGARILGRFHRVIGDIAHVFESTHPLHDTRGHMEGLRVALAGATPEIGALAREVLDALPPLLLPSDLPRRVVHGDPKISNIRFEGERATGWVDLDTCMPHSVLVDLGDAVRSWCRDGAEDEAQCFHLDRFEAILRGYAAEGPTLARAEIDRLADAGRLITLELAGRFVRDAIEDHYFGWDAARYPSRRAHNLARARAMIHLAREMADRRAEVVDAVRRAYRGSE